MDLKEDAGCFGFKPQIEYFTPGRSCRIQLLNGQEDELESWNSEHQNWSSLTWWAYGSAKTRKEKGNGCRSLLQVENFWTIEKNEKSSTYSFPA